MKLKNILAGVAFMSGIFGAQAQEYLNVSGPNYTQYFQLDEIDSVTIGTSTMMLSTQIAANERVSIYNAALQATGLASLLTDYFYDDAYDASSYSWYYYKSDTHNEVAIVPDYKRKGYTLFITPDSVLSTKYGIHNLEDLVVKVKSLYDQTYPEDAGLYDDDYTHPKNPLNRYIRYTILKCDVRDLNRLAGRILYDWGDLNGVYGIRTDKMNPTEWYQTLLPNTMMKCEQLTMKQYAGDGVLNDFYINRRYDANYQVEGAHIAPTIESENRQEASNGRYFYVNELVAFTPDVRDKVHDTRIRMDMSTVFPELVTHDIRQNGTMKADVQSSGPFENGCNYWFPQGYLEGVTSENNSKLVYRRPQIGYWCYQGDEFIILGDYDIEFKLPPVPYSGTWQIRLGYSVLPGRGMAKIYFDGIQQGDTIDFRLPLNDASIMGEDFDKVSYDDMTKEEKADDQRRLKEKGYYRGPAGAYYGHDMYKYETLAQTPRRVLCQVYIDNTQEHYLRIQNASPSMTGYNYELMLDYIELVPKSFYDVPEGEMEDDL